MRMESILSRFCSSGGSGSRSFWILPSTRKPEIGVWRGVRGCVRVCVEV